MRNYIALSKSGDTFYIQDKDDSTKYQTYKLTADPVGKTGYTELTISWQSGGTALVNNQRALVSLSRVGPQGPPGVVSATAPLIYDSGTQNMSIDLSAYAPLNSPTFTGNPRAPTPATSANDVSIATTAFVKAQGYITGASPALTGNPTAPTPTAGDNDTSIATTAFVTSAIAAIPAAPVVPIGQCYLSFSSSNLLLSPFNGNQIFINSAFRAIPDVGVTLSPSTAVSGGAVAATTLYYIYAYWTGSAIAMEAVTTAYATQTGTGIRIKSGDATRTLVGMWSSAAASAWSTNTLEGSSYFNPRKKYAIGAGTTMGPSTTSTSLVEMNTNYRLPFVNFAERMIRLFLNGRASNSTNGISYYWAIYLDGTTSILQQSAGMLVCAGAGDAKQVHCEANISFSEARHYATGFHAVTSGTGSGSDLIMAGEMWG
ncbi:MAG TPA: hypothetical protein VKG24_29210 [Pseudolabrys sp.]|nr:hypothetical protein [Pseudolabrys sp.]